MQTKTVQYGTEHLVDVVDASPLIITVHDTVSNEGYLLVGHGLATLPNKGDKGKIIFESDKRSGHWQYYPLTFCRCLYEIENKLPRTKHCFKACDEQIQILKERKH